MTPCWLSHSSVNNKYMKIYPCRALAHLNRGQLETFSWTGWLKNPCLWAPIVLFLTSFRCQWVSPKSSHPCPHCACSPHPHLHPHVEGLESLNKDAQRLGSLEPCHRVKLSYREGRLQTGEPRRFSQETRTASWLHARHGTEEIYFGHRARAQELRRRVGNCMDDGQRWASCIHTRCCSTARCSGRASCRPSVSSVMSHSVNRNG